jgi:DNA repair protein SbcC/Rad50
VIIQSLTAENILKYRRLDLRDLPEHGLIAISGQNESGKSTIGETICFALFGRTFSLDQDEINKLILWGENRCSVTMTFREQDGESFSITRSLDMEGNQSARLWRLADPDNPMATGKEAVDKALFALTAYGYDEFIESFYLAQREITSPQPHSMTLKTIAGLSTLEKGAFMVEGEMHRDEDEVASMQAELSLQQDELTGLDLDPDHLDNLVNEKSRADQEQEHLAERINHYESTLEEYSRVYPKLVGHNTTRGRLSFWLSLNSLMLLTLVSAWLLMTIQPNLKQSWLDIFSPYLPDGIGWLLLPAIPIGLLLKSYNTSIRRLRLPGVALGAALLDHEQNQGLDNELLLQSEKLAQQANESSLEGAALSVEMQPLLTHLKTSLEENRTRSEGLDEPILEEEKRREQATALELRIVELEGIIEDRTRHNQARRISIELLAGACTHLSRRFNHVIREHVGMTLPLFTEDRYEHLQIEDDMTIQVFSNEKRGYLDLDEISSGTQRQIMLAVRLALSQELACRRVGSNQFLILDEPFAFFDQERTINSLGVLPELSTDLPQIFVTSQVFPEGSDFQREIACSRDTTELR